MTSSSTLQTPGPGFDLMRMDRQIQRRLMRQRALPIAAFAGLVIAGVSKRGAWGWLGVSAGLVGLARQLLIWHETRPEWQKQAQPALSLRRWIGGGGDEPIDHSSATSFPASDPPGSGAENSAKPSKPL